MIMTLKTLPSPIRLSSQISSIDRDGRFCREKDQKLYTLSLPMTLSAHVSSHRHHHSTRRHGQRKSAHVNTVSARRHHHSAQRQNSQPGSHLSKPFTSHRTIDTKTAPHQRSYPVDAALLSADLFILLYHSGASVCRPFSS